MNFIKNKTLLLAFSLISILIVGVVLKIRLEKQEALSDFHRYSDSLLREDFLSAYQMTTTEFKNATSYQAFSDGQRQLIEEFGRLRATHLDGYSVQTEESVKNWSAILTVTLVFDKGNCRFVFEMHKQDGTWKMFGLRRLPPMA